MSGPDVTGHEAGLVPPEARARWRRIENLLDSLLELPEASRPAFLADDAETDPDLRAEVESLLASCAIADGFLDQPLGEFAAPVVSDIESLEQHIPATARLQPGDHIGRYQVVRSIGQGGMGDVYLANDSRLDRQIAVKLLPRFLSVYDDATRRFTAEAKTASSLDHPNIAPIYEIDETDDGQLFITMAYCEGETLKDRIARGPLDQSEAIDIALQVARGLAAAHEKGIVHRDIKPANIVIGLNGIVRIIDFGIAKVDTGTTLTQTGTAIGTAAYMSPEQTFSDGVDHRSDLWSLGVMLYESLTGERPFQADDQASLIFAVRTDEPKPLDRAAPEISKDLARVVDACLAKDPAHRVSSADDLRERLESLQQGVGPAGAAARRSSPVRAWIAAAPIVLVIVAAAIAIVRFSTRPPIDPSLLPIAILPFTPLTEDTTLSLLGHQLATAVSINLEGVAEVRVTPPITVMAQIGDARETTEPGQSLARVVGARSFVEGSILRIGDDVRVDLALYDAESLERLARTSVVMPADDFVALSDSLSLSLLKPIWRRGSPPVPSLEALTTSSLPSLDAYVRGEQAFAEARWVDAVRFFESAFAADSTFWFALWRSAYPRVNEGTGLGERWAGIIDHRDEFPEPDRLLVEARIASSLGEKMAIVRRVAEEFPDYWPGLFQHANQLIHWAPYLGVSYPETRVAFERLVTIQPAFLTGWIHLFWIAVYQSDVELARHALEEMVEMSRDADTRLRGQMLQYQALLDLLESDGVYGQSRLQHDAGMLIRMADTIPIAAATTQLSEYGFHGAQIQFNDETLRQGAPPHLREAHLMGRALAWASRGAWDSAMATVDRWLAEGEEPRTPLMAYGLTVAGALLGQVDSQLVQERRERAAGSGFADSTAGRAELAWLDGVAAWQRDDAVGIRASREILGGIDSADVRDIDLLDGSLAAFEAAAAGNVEQAGRLMAQLEWESADRRRHWQYARYHPYLGAINRMAASEWLLAVGDTAQAARLLTWHEAVLWGRMARARMANRLMEPVAYLRRARIAQAQGQPQRAREHYRAFLSRYDRPPAEHRVWIEEAEAAIALVMN